MTFSDGMPWARPRRGPAPRQMLLRTSAPADGGHAAGTLLSQLRFAFVMTLLLWLVFFLLGMAFSGRIFQNGIPGRLTLLTTPGRSGAAYYIFLSRFPVSAPESYIAYLSLYPVALGLLARLGCPSAAAALLLSFSGTVFGLAAVQAIVDDGGRHAAARRAVCYIMLSPVSFYFLNGYSEGFFFGLSAWCLLCARRGMWGQAGIFGALASLTRVTGVFLLIGVVIEYVQQPRCSRRPQDLAPLMMIAAAAACLVLYPVIALGSTYSLIGIENHLYGRFWATPWHAALLAVRAMCASSLPLSLLDASKLLAAGCWLALLLLGWRRLPTSLWAYLACGGILLCNVTHLFAVPWWSLDRFLTVLFPGAIVLAMLEFRPKWHWLLWVLSAMCLAVEWALFVNGYWG